MRRARQTFANRIQSALKGFFSGYGGDGAGGLYDFYGIWPFLPGSQFDYRTEAGNLWENSIVLSCIQWIASTFPEAILGCDDNRIDPHWNPDHPAARLIENPNPFYDGSILWAGVVLSLITDGNAYLRKVRSRSGEVVELWYVPSFTIGPVWPKDGSKFISGYVMTVDGKNIPLAVEDVVHIRHHVSNPQNYRVGLSPLRAALREVCTDNEAAEYTAALLRNSGVPGAMLSPKGTDPDGRPYVFEKKQREDLLATWRQKFTGSSRGDPLVAPIPMEVSQFAFNPEQLLIDKAALRPEARICSLIGIQPVVIGLNVGLETSTAKASYEDARKAAYESCVVPMQERIARQLDRQLMPDFAEPGTMHFGWDRSGITILSPEVEDVYDRAGQAFSRGFITANEARQMVGLEPITGGDELPVAQVTETDTETERE